MLRIIGGRWRGRRLQAPKGMAVRPTAEKVRGGILNMLTHRGAVAGACLFDLYAGTGALGLEALSRGAARVVFVESNPRTAARIRETLRALEADPATWEVVTAKAETWLRQGAWGEAPDALLLDPPYAAGVHARLLGLIAAAPGVPDGAWVVLETSARQALETPPGLELSQVKGYGDTNVWLLHKTATPPST